MDITPAQYYTAWLPGIIVGALVLYGVAGFLWNKYFVPRQQLKGKKIKKYGKTVKENLDIAFKEDDFTLATKSQNKLLRFLLSLRGFNVILIILTAIMLGIYPGMLGANIRFDVRFSWVPFILFFILVWVRSAPIKQKRGAILDKMFTIATGAFHFPKGSELTPWNYVSVQTWSGANPRQIVVQFPISFDASGEGSRQGFERHFNASITDENSWSYDWDTIKSTVTVKAVNHIPTMAPYQGSEKYPWNVIPIGLGLEGDVSFDLSSAPHLLVTGTTGSGKASDLSALIFTTEGSKKIGELIVGDTLFNPDGSQTRINHLHPVITPAKAYKLTFKNGETIITDPEHLWVTETRRARVSRFDNDINESSRQRNFWLDEDIVTKLQTELNNTTSSDVISIPDMAEMCGKLSSTENNKIRGSRMATHPLFYQVSKEIGVAELHTPTYIFHYDAQEFEQYQTVTTVETNEFIKLYNEKTWLPSSQTPLTNFTYEKIKELERELRNTDTMKFEDFVSHVNGQSKLTLAWLESNWNKDLNTKQNVENLIALAETEKAYDIMPTKIFSFAEGKERVMTRDVADLLGVTELRNSPEGQRVKSVFSKIASKATTSKKERIKVKVITGGYETKKQGQPIEMFPKKLFIERLLQHNETPTNDQRWRRELASVKTTQELFETLTVTEASGIYANHTITKTKALQLPEQDLPIHPYAFGAWLGDGRTTSGNVCGEDYEIFDYIEECGYPATNGRNKIIVPSYRRKKDGSINEKFRIVAFKQLSDDLKKAGLRPSHSWRIRKDGEYKHIPAQYLIASEEQRRELLRGLLDTDGSVDKRGRITFHTSNERLVEPVKWLISGLGYIPFVSTKIPKYVLDKETGEKQEGKRAYTIGFQAPPEDRLFMLPRKNAKHAKYFTGENLEHSYAEAHYIVKIEEVEPVPMRCISVDSDDRQFLITSSMIPTHNSVLQRNLIFHAIQHNDSMRFMGIDLKRVELGQFRKYEQTIMGIGTTLEDAVEILRYTQKVMENRYERMEAAGVNHFKDMIDPETGKPDYAIMLMVDEAGELLSTEGTKSDEGKVRDQLHGDAMTILGSLARLGRAAGIHLVIATQRPDAKIIAGEFKNNLAVRILAGRSGSIASSMTLDSGSGMMLPPIKGRGMLSIYGQEQQFQGYYAEAEWIDKWLESHPGVEPTLVPAVDGQEALPEFDETMGGEELEKLTQMLAHGKDKVDPLSESPEWSDETLEENWDKDEMESDENSTQQNSAPIQIIQPELSIPSEPEPQADTTTDDDEDEEKRINDIIARFAAGGNETTEDELEPPEIPTDIALPTENDQQSALVEESTPQVNVTETPESSVQADKNEIPESPVENEPKPVLAPLPTLARLNPLPTLPKTIDNSKTAVESSDIKPLPGITGLPPLPKPPVGLPPLPKLPD